MAKLMKLFVALLALGLVAASCGGDDDGAEPAPVESEVVEPEVEATEATEAPEPEAEEVTISIESWRSDDQAIWDEQIIPAFEAEFPHISVEFTPTPPLEYPPALRTRLEGGVAGDLITCQPFDRPRELYEDGHLAPLNDLDGIDSFGPSAQKRLALRGRVDTVLCACCVDHPGVLLQCGCLQRAGTERARDGVGALRCASGDP